MREELCDPLSPRGRLVFAKVPTGFGLLGEELRRFYDGVERVLKVPGIVPGRQDARVIWVGRSTRSSLLI